LIITHTFPHRFLRPSRPRYLAALCAIKSGRMADL